MWRRTERASLEKKHLDEVEPGAVLLGEGKFETAGRLIGEPSLCLLGAVGGMIVEDQLDRGMGRIGGVEKLEKFDEFAAAVAVLDEGVNLAGQQVDAGQQTDRAVALILMIAREGRVHAGLGRLRTSPQSSRAADDCLAVAAQLRDAALKHGNDGRRAVHHGQLEGTDLVVLDPRFKPLFAGYVRVERLWTGARWSEGPAWFAARRYLVWSDIPNNRMLRYVEPSGEVSVFREPANNSNGNTVDNQGRLCEHLTRRVTRTEVDGSISVVAAKWQGKRLNSPNDIVVKSDDSIWFTDPAYGIDSDNEGDRAEPEIDGCHVYRFDASGSVERVIDDMTRPNGLAFSPDERFLYVADTGATHKENGPRHIRRFAVSKDGKKARSSPSRRPGCSTASASTGTGGSGRAPTRACIATIRTER